MDALPVQRCSIRRNWASSASVSAPRVIDAEAQRSVTDFFGQLVPADPVADVGPQLPLHRSWASRRPAPAGTRPARAGRTAGRAAAAPGSRRPARAAWLQVAGDGPPPAPVRAEHLAEPVGVDDSGPSPARLRPAPAAAPLPPPARRRAAGGCPWRPSRSARRSAAWTAARRPRPRSTAGCRTTAGSRACGTWSAGRPSRRSGRPDGALKYICRSPLRLLNRLSGSQPLLLQVGRDVLAALGQAGEVHVLAGAQPRREVGRAEHPDGEPAEQLEPEAGLRGAAGQPDGLGQRIVSGGGRVGLARCLSCPRLLPDLGTSAWGSASSAQYRRGPQERFARRGRFPALTGAGALAILVACHGPTLPLAQPTNRRSGCWPC